MIMSIIKKIYKLASLLLVVLVAIYILANLKDDKLREEVKEAIIWQVPVDALEKDNGYVLIHGMYAPIGHDPYKYGRAILDEEIAQYEAFQKTRRFPKTLERDETNPYAKWEGEACNNSDTKNTLDFYLKQDAASTANLASKFQTLSERFEAIRGSKKFVEIQPPLFTSAIPSYIPLRQAFDLERILAIREIADGRTDLGIKRLATNNEFGRRILKNSGTLITHMVAISILQKDSRLVSELLSKYPELANKHLDLLNLILSPISEPDYKLDAAFIGERLLTMTTTDVITSQTSSHEKSFEYILNKIYLWLTWLPNNTRNLYFDRLNDYVELSKADAHTLALKIEQIQKKQEKDLGIGYDFFYLRNPMGKILVSVSEPSYIDYIERHHDLDGYLTLVRLQLKILTGTVSKSNLNQILPNYLNPYTLQPMQVDTQNGVIVFEGRQPSTGNYNKSKAYQIPLPQ